MNAKFVGAKVEFEKNIKGHVFVGKSWWELLIEFIELALPFILALIKGEVADPEELINYLTKQWMTYCNVTWLPDWLEEKIISQIITVIITIIIKLFKNGNLN